MAYQPSEIWEQTFCINLVLSLIDQERFQVDDDVLNIAKKMALSEGNVSALKTMESLSP